MKYYKTDSGMAMQVFTMGNMVFTLSGQDRILAPLRNELSCISGGDPSEARLRFVFGRLPAMEQYCIAPPIWIGRDSFRVHGAGFHYQVCYKNEQTVVHVASEPPPKSRRLLPRGLSRARHWNYLDPDEDAAKNFMYSVFDYITQIEQLKAGQSYIHGSTFHKGGRAYGVVAWGGIGKTTSMLKLAGERGYGYLSDDLGVLTREGKVALAPKSMQIYAYNLEGEPNLKKKLMTGRSLMDRLNWEARYRVKGGKAVRRRVSAAALFQERISSERLVPMVQAFYIERSNAKHFEVAEISSSEMAARASRVVMDEISPFGKIAAAIHSSSFRPGLPTFQKVFEDTETLLAEAFSNVKLLLVKIPAKASPTELADRLEALMT